MRLIPCLSLLPCPPPPTHAYNVLQVYFGLSLVNDHLLSSEAHYLVLIGLYVPYVDDHGFSKSTLVFLFI